MDLLVWLFPILVPNVSGAKRKQKNVAWVEVSPDFLFAPEKWECTQKSNWQYGNEWSEFFFCKGVSCLVLNKEEVVKTKPIVINCYL